MTISKKAAASVRSFLFNLFECAGIAGARSILEIDGSKMDRRHRCLHDGVAGAAG
jgi:hypothetical protein